MANAVAKQGEFAYDAPTAPTSRTEVLARYRHLREISVQHNDDVLKLLSRDAVLQHARRLGLAFNRTIVLDNMDDLHFAFDLAIYTAPPGRTRAIERYARAARFSPESDEALMIRAMCNARFALIHVERRHELAGLVVTDLFRCKELWLVDEGMEISFPDGGLVATRLYTPESFSMSAGVLVPLDTDLLEVVLDEVPQLGRKRVEDAVDDRRFAEAVYRIAIESGVTENVEYRDLVSDAG
jgi:hypothetical protein